MPDDIQILREAFSYKKLNFSSYKNPINVIKYDCIHNIAFPKQIHNCTCTSVCWFHKCFWYSIQMRNRSCCLKLWYCLANICILCTRHFLKKKFLFKDKCTLLLLWIFKGIMYLKNVFIYDNIFGSFISIS